MTFVQMISGQFQLVLAVIYNTRGHGSR